MKILVGQTSANRKAAPKAECQDTTTFRSFVRLAAAVKSCHSFSVRLWAVSGQAAFRTTSAITAVRSNSAVMIWRRYYVRIDRSGPLAFLC